MSFDRPVPMAILALSLAFVAGAGSVQADPRLEAAREALATQDTYPEAIAGFRAILADRPDHREARLQLGRVLSWSKRYPESLAEYAQLVERYPADLEARVEYAEVLSWSGDYARARVEFLKLVERDPRNARALLGLARIHRWSGNGPMSDRWYRRALAVDDSVEARAEWLELRSDYRPAAALHGKSYRDKSDFSRRDYRIEGALYTDPSTLLRLKVGRVEVHHSQSDVDLRIRRPHDNDRAVEVGTELERHWSLHWKTRFELGLRSWDHAESRPFARARTEFLADDLNVIFQLERTDHLDRSDSFEALQRGLRQLGGSIGAWKGLNERWSTWGQVGWLRVTDGNQRFAADASLTFQPWAKRQLAFSVGVHALSYDDESPYYWDPELDLGATLGLDHTLPLRGDLRLRYTGQIGFGQSDTREGTEEGVIGGATAELSWQRAGWKAYLRGEHSYSQRDVSYRAHSVQLGVERSF